MGFGIDRSRGPSNSTGILPGSPHSSSVADGEPLQQVRLESGWSFEGFSRHRPSCDVQGLRRAIPAASRLDCACDLGDVTRPCTLLLLFLVQRGNALMFAAPPPPRDLTAHLRAARTNLQQMHDALSAAKPDIRKSDAYAAYRNLPRKQRANNDAEFLTREVNGAAYMFGSAMVVSAGYDFDDDFGRVMFDSLAAMTAWHPISFHAQWLELLSLNPAYPAHRWGNTVPPSESRPAAFRVRCSAGGGSTQSSSTRVSKTHRSLTATSSRCTSGSIKSSYPTACSGYWPSRRRLLHLQGRHRRFPLPPLLVLNPPSSAIPTTRSDSPQLGCVTGATRTHASCQSAPTVA